MSTLTIDSPVPGLRLKPDGKIKEIRGKGTPGDAVVVTLDNHVLGVVEVDANGDWCLKGSGSGDGDGQGKPDSRGNGGPGKGEQEMSDHGSGSDGEARGWEAGDPGENGNPAGIAEAEGQAVRRDVATKIKDPSNNRGTLPAGWNVWADTMLQPPKVRWQDKLRAIARQAVQRVRGERMSTYRRLARTSIVSNFGVIKPTTYDIVPTVVIVVDTSGSMGAGKGSRLERALSECEAILKLNKVKSYFLDCDANVYGTAQDIKSVCKAQVHGGGGTDMALGVRAALKNKPKPDIIVLLTDGETPWPEAHELTKIKMITCICGPIGEERIPSYMNPIFVDD